MSLVAVGLLASVAACGGGESEVAPTTTAAPPPAAATTAVEEQPQAVIERDLAFATHNGATLTLNLYIPADPNDAPIMIEPWGSAGSTAIGASTQ